jgi:hypothetical protein
LERKALLRISPVLSTSSPPPPSWPPWFCLKRTLASWSVQPVAYMPPPPTVAVLSASSLSIRWSVLAVQLMPAPSVIVRPLRIVKPVIETPVPPVSRITTAVPAPPPSMVVAAAPSRLRRSSGLPTISMRSL